jgi:tetratricopeptide (TPR) repeat protein
MKLIACLLFLLMNSSNGFSTIDIDNFSYRRVKVVYDEVARAFGDGRPSPRLVLVAGEKDAGTAARIENAVETAGELFRAPGSRKEVTIFLSERAISLLATLGEDMDNGLAFLLGHELAHFYLRHGWVAQFGNSFSALNVGKTMNRTASMDDIIKVETEADYFGGFYGHLAGYNALGVAPRVLDLIYAAYHYPEQIPNYPSLTERKLIAQNAAINLQKLIPVFDAANLLLLTEQYEPAARLYEYLGRTFPSREIHNNTGVAYALAALRLYKPGLLTFAYPFELDAETRLRQPQGKLRLISSQQNEELRHLLLKKAADAFEAAIHQDPKYAAAYVNYAAITSLLGDNDTALLHANRAMELARLQNENAVLSDALVIRGILYALNGNRDRALVDFAAARNYGTPIALINLTILQGEKKISPKSEKEIRSLEVEKISGMSPSSPFMGKRNMNSFTLEGAVKEDPIITIESSHHGGWEAGKISVGRKTTSMVSTLRNYVGNTARGIRIGAGKDDIRNVYGEPTRIISTRRGFYLVYRDNGIIFSLDPSLNLTGWILYDFQ